MNFTNESKDLTFEGFVFGAEELSFSKYMFGKKADSENYFDFAPNDEQHQIRISEASHNLNSFINKPVHSYQNEDYKFLFGMSQILF